MLGIVAHFERNVKSDKGCVKFLLFLQPRTGGIPVEMPLIRKPTIYPPNPDC